MRVKVIDASHEKDLEKKINEELLKIEGEIVDIKFSNCCMRDEDNDQIYCFSALIIYKN